MQENQFLLFLNHLRFPYSIPKSFALLLAFHVARHTFAVLALRQHKNLYAVSKLLGHTSIRATEKTYAEFLPEDYKKISLETIDFDIAI